MASTKLLYARRGALTADTYTIVKYNDRIIFYCKLDELMIKAKASHLSKYFRRENRPGVLSFLIRRQVIKETEGIGLLSTSHSPSG